MKSHTRHVLTAGIVLGVLAIGAGAFIWSGLYNIGADEPHWMPTRVAIENLRERSIAARMADAQVPNLDDPRRIASGAVNYSAMCTGCHLAPGVTDSEIRPGLYPTPPDLSKLGSQDAKRTFWIIKHGIKMSAMPAWGKTHTDEQIWNMTAFIRKMPGMTAAQYQALGGKPPQEDEDHMHAGMGDEHAAMAMPGMDMSGKTMQTPPAHAPGAPADHHGAEAAPANTGPVEHRHADGTIESHPALPLLVVSKNASCGCCKLWVEHMRQAGFTVQVHDIDNLDPVKTRVGIPAGKGSCHTAEVGGYFIEGHVPAQDVKRLLAEKPDARGLVLPGMPTGSPGMEMPGVTARPYAVELVKHDGSTEVFAQH